MFFFEDFFKVAVFVQFRYRQKYQLVVVPDQHTSGWFKEVLSLCCYSSREPACQPAGRGEGMVSFCINLVKPNLNLVPINLFYKTSFLSRLPARIKRGKCIHSCVAISAKTGLLLLSCHQMCHPKTCHQLCTTALANIK